MDSGSIIQVFKEKPITELAKEEAAVISLPEGYINPYSARMDKEWAKAFDWYNKHINAKQHPLGMGCAPCFFKVKSALLKAQNRELSENGQEGG